MSLANKFTLLRVILAPVFFFFYFISREAWTVPVLIIIFVFAELTDYYDGWAARKYNEISDFGKFFDPFADTLLQLTCFLCFVIDGIFMVPLFLLVIYREFGILFLRNLMLKKSVTMGARISGKVKTVLYIIAASFALAVVSIQRVLTLFREGMIQTILELLLPYFKISAAVIFIISVIISIISFIDYYLIYRKT